MAEDKKTVNAFELADLLEACLPNGTLSHSTIITNALFEQCIILIILFYLPLPKFVF